MEHRWNDPDRGKLKYWGKTLSQCHRFPHKSHMDLPGIIHDLGRVGGCGRDLAQPPPQNIIFDIHVAFWKSCKHVCYLKTLSVDELHGVGSR
jgi:hypothetical protein